MTTITIKIANEERQIESVDPQWINQQINRRKADGENVCVRVSVHGPGIELYFATPTCGGGGGRGRPFTAVEQAIVDLWLKLGLSEQSFTGGNVVAFLKQLKSML